MYGKATRPAPTHQQLLAHPFYIAELFFSPAEEQVLYARFDVYKRARRDNHDSFRMAWEDVLVWRQQQAKAQPVEAE